MCLQEERASRKPSNVCNLELAQNRVPQLDAGLSEVTLKMIGEQRLAALHDSNQATIDQAMQKQGVLKVFQKWSTLTAVSTTDLSLLLHTLLYLGQAQEKPQER